MSFTVAACLMSGAFLVLALQYVRRSKLPAFDLERAIASGEIKPYYQPVINLKTGALSGCDVLCRREKRNGEMVMPGDFIDYFEITELRPIVNSTSAHSFIDCMHALGVRLSIDDVGSGLSNLAYMQTLGVD